MGFRILDPDQLFAISVQLTFLGACALARGRWRIVSSVALAAALTLLLWHPFAPDIHPTQVNWR
jgi:hypothetical protein